MRAEETQHERRGGACKITYQSGQGETGETGTVRTVPREGHCGRKKYEWCTYRRESFE